jgi:enamine deaminase RidA (YjgF/YER057c/UK114 family)
MKSAAALVLATGCLGGCVIADVDRASCAQPGDISRQYVSPTAFYAKHVAIPPGYQTIRLPGIIPDPLSSGEFDGDTENQAENVFAKIAVALKEAGATEADVVAMTVYLAAPTPGGSMDFDGMMRAYGRHYGSAAQPNRPVRSTVQVAGLVRPGVFVEIEVTAAVRPLNVCGFEWKP